MKSIHNLSEFYLKLLKKNLRKQNSFLSLSSPSPRFNSNAKEFSTIFSNAVIMMNIMKSNSLIAKDILERLNLFLKDQKHGQLSFNYWDYNVTEYKKIPYPDDLDDTFCALTALHEYDNKYLTGRDLRKITELLVYQEADVGGPYFTWITDGNDIEWKDIDLAVNSNIAYFLSHFDIHLPNISSFIEKAIVNDKVLSRYYPQSTPVGYFISKWYRGYEKSKLVLILEKMYNSKQSTILDKILVSTSLLNYDLIQHPYIEKTLASITREPNIVISPYSFYRGVNPLSDGKKYYSGSQNLTISFAIEFLSEYMRLKGLSRKNRDKNNDHIELINKKTFQIVSKELKTASGPIKKYGLEKLNEMLKNPDMAMITAIPYIAYKSAGGKKRINEKLLTSLSSATLFGWLAYDIYDDFFDNQGSPIELSVANFALRKLTDLFTSDLLPSEFHEYFHKTMNTVDNANSRESLMPVIKFNGNYLKIDKDIVDGAGKVNRLYEKSIGHILGVVAVYSLLDKPPEHMDTRNVIKFFKNYLTVRQLIDDMHDWEADLHMGKLNSSSSRMVIHAFNKGKKKVTLSQLRSLFWEETVLEICKLGNRYLSKSEGYSPTFKKILNPLRDVLNDTLERQQKAVQFIS